MLKQAASQWMDDDIEEAKASSNEEGKCRSRSQACVIRNGLLLLLLLDGWEEVAGDAPFSVSIPPLHFGDESIITEVSVSNQKKRCSQRGAFTVYNNMYASDRTNTRRLLMDGCNFVFFCVCKNQRFQTRSNRAPVCPARQRQPALRLPY